MDILVFLDGPVVLRPVDLVSSSASTSLAVGAVAGTISSDPSTASRAWWWINRQAPYADEMDVSESLLYLRDILQRDRYDVSIFYATSHRVELTSCRVCLASGIYYHQPSWVSLIGNLVKEQLWQFWFPLSYVDTWYYLVQHDS
jgi:hypothetical protein